MIFLANVYLSIHCSRNPIWLVVHHSTSASNNKSNKSRINRCASYIKPNRTKLRVWIKLGVVDSQQGFEAKSSNDNAILSLLRTNMTLNRAPLPQKMLPNAFNQSNRYTQFDQANRSSNCVPNYPKSSLLSYSEYTLDIGLYLCISPPYMRNVHDRNIYIYIRVLKQCLQ